MATTVSAMDMVRARRDGELRTLQAVDEVAVEAFVAGAAGATRDQMIAVIQRMHGEIKAGRARREANLETMAAIADRLTAMVAAQ